MTKLNSMNRVLTPNPYRILFASHAIQSLGGLSDLAAFTSAMTTALSTMGHDVRLILPAYSALLSALDSVTQISTIKLPGTHRGARLLQGHLSPGLPLYLVDIPGQFDQPESQYIDENGRPQPKNALRFGLFSRVVALMAINQAGINWQPELLHCNGWETALAIPLLANEWSRPATVYTLHESEQPQFRGDQISALALPVELLKSGILERQGRISYEKGTLLTADVLALTSAGFREEILEDQTSHPLAHLIKKRRDQLYGIPSGLDYQYWSPTTDRHIEQHYDSTSFELKKLNRQRLVSELSLPLNDRDMLIAYLATSSNTDNPALLASLLESLVPDAPLHILVAAAQAGPALQPLLDSAASHPGRISIHPGITEPQWHRILASSDCLLLPATRHPSAHQAQCALSYGTVPIAQTTASLRNTLTDATPANLLHGNATAFLYDDATLEPLNEAVSRAMACHAKPAIWWQKLARQGMDQSFPITETAAQYLECYQAAIDHPITYSLS